MAGDDFSDILDVIRRIVLFVLNRTTDVICASLFIFSCAAVWRWGEIIEHFDWSTWKSCALESAALTLLDIFVAPFFILSLVSPLQWRNIKNAFVEYRSENDISSCFELRLDLASICFDSILDVVSISLLIISGVAIWRWTEITAYQGEISSQNSEWRKNALSSLCLTLTDFVLAPFLLMTLLSPFQWIALMKKYNENRNDYDDAFDLRNDLCACFCYAIYDFCAFVALIIQHVFPTRVCFVYGNIIHFLSTDNDNSLRVDTIIIKSCGSTCIDFVYLVPGIVATVLCPSLWHSTIQGACCILTPLPSSKYDWRDSFHRLRQLVVSRVLFLFLDLAAIVMGLIAVISPLRSVYFRRCICEDGFTVFGYRGCADTKEMKTARPFKTDELSEHQQAYVDSYYSVYNYNVALRADCYNFGALAVIDILMYPLLIPLILTWYRFAPIKDKLFCPAPPSRHVHDESFCDSDSTKTSLKMIDPCNMAISLDGVPSTETTTGDSTVHVTHDVSPTQMMEESGDLRNKSYSTSPVISTGESKLYPAEYLSKGWGYDEIYAILRQFVFLLIDILCLPWGILLMLTFVRWPPVREAMRNDDLCSQLSFVVYSKIAEGIGLLLLDILCLPFTVVVIVTRYRSDHILKIWDQRGTPSMNVFFHCSVLTNFCVILHDIVFLPILSIFVLVSGTRSHTVFYILQQLRTPPSGANGAEEHLDSEDYITRLRTYIRMNWRKEMWLAFLNALIDIPFVAISIFILCTVWRSKTLVHEVMKEHDRNCYNKYNRIRIAVLYQLLYLFRDALFVIPFTIVVATFYRLPALISGILSTCHSFSRDDPVFFATNVEFTCQERGGVFIRITCRRNLSNCDDIERTEDEDVTLYESNSTAKLFIDGSSFWECAADTFGRNTANIGRGFLPLKFVNGKSINLPEKKVALSGEVGLQDNELCGGLKGTESSEEFEMWLQLDFGTTKRSTIEKKLRLLQQSTQLLIQIEASPSPTARNQSSVVLTLIPSVSDLLQVFSAGGPHLLAARAYDSDASLRRSIVSDIELHTTTGGVVDQFWIHTGLAFVEILLDFIHLLLLFFTFVIPWRGIELLVWLNESPLHSTLREARSCCKMLVDISSCLHNYHADVIPLMNSLVKKLVGASESQDSMLGERPREIFHYKEGVIRGRLHRLERATLHPYLNGSKTVLRRLEKSGDSLSTLRGHIASILDVQKSRLMYRFVRTTAALHFANSNYLIDPTVEDDCGLLDQILMYFDNCAIRSERDIFTRIDNYISTLVKDVREQTPLMKWKKRFFGFVFKSSSESRRIIRHVAYSALKDLFGLCMVLLILLTVVRALPLFLDLYRNKVWKNHYTKRRILLSHVRGTYEDIRAGIVFALHVLFVLILVVGVPSFVEELPQRMRTLEEGTQCAKEHIRRTFTYFAEVLTLVFSWKTYRVALRASLYCALVPPACIAEAIPKQNLSATQRFWIGFVSFTGLVFGALYVSLGVTDDPADEAIVRESFVYLCTALGIVVALAAVSSSFRQEYLVPVTGASGSISLEYSMSWSHVLAILCGPLECVQLASVVLYFYWPNGELNDEMISFPSFFTFGYATDIGESYGYNIALGLASCCVLLWCVVVSLPLVYHEDIHTLYHLQSSEIFDFVYVMMSRLIYVSVLATLMRPLSCVSDNNTLVISTARHIECGRQDGVAWSSVASLVLLVYFVVTSTVLHSDAPEMMESDTSEFKVKGVRFAPLYAIVLRLGQLAICTACFASASVTERGPTLVVVMCLSLSLVLWSGYFSGRACSLPAVPYIRSGGFLVLFWCTLLCYLRGHAHSYTWATDKILCIGTAVILCLAVIWGVVASYRARVQWKNGMIREGLGEAIASLDACASEAMDERAVGGSYAGSKARVTTFLKQAEDSCSVGHLARLLIAFEEKVLVERQTLEFHISRNEWRQALLRDTLGPFESSCRGLIRGADVLRGAIKPKSPVGSLNRTVVALLFRNKLPEFVAWEVFSYLYDIEPIVNIIADVLDGECRRFEIYRENSLSYTDCMYSQARTRITPAIYVAVESRREAAVEDRR